MDGIIERDWAPEEPRRACRPTVVWTPERIARLKALAPAHTCTVVSEMLGVSRGSVSSHASRLGVSFRQGDTRPEKPRADGWPADRIAILRRMAPDNSASTIALAVGVTRNAVIGKAQRMGIKLRGRSEAAGAREAYLARERERKNAANIAKRGPPKPVGRPVGFKVTTPRIPKPTAEEVRVAMFEAAPDDAVRLVDIKTFGCRWPYGDPREDDFRFCGHPATGSYCAAHHGIVYRATPGMSVPPLRMAR